MAEILCGVLSGSDSSQSEDPCDAATRAARRRRMEIRRLRIVSGLAAAEQEPLLKKRRLGFSPSTPSPPVSSPCPSPSPSPSPPPSPIRQALDLNQKSSDDEESIDEGPSAPPSAETPEAEQTEDADAAVPVVRVSNRCPGYGMTSVCGRRREMEDAVSIQPAFNHGDNHQGGSGTTGGETPLHFFGVFDGHGCSHVADSCKQRMHEVVAEELQAAVPVTPSQWEDFMRRSFSIMDAEVTQHPAHAGVNRRRQQQELPRPGPLTGVPPRPRGCRCELQAASASSLSKCDHVGSTAVVAVLTPDHIVLANCGDSRAVLCRSGAAVPLSVDHKPDRPDELRRIQDAGGRVIYWDGARVLGVLAMSRAIGDYHLKPFVTSDPEVTVTERTDADECLVIASDGLWDVVTSETACDVARMCLKASDPRSADAASSANASDDEAVRIEAQGRDRRGGSDAACVDAAMLLTKLALARGTADNVSVVVVDLRSMPARGARPASGQANTST